MVLVVGELLSKTARTFDPLNVLLKRDIWVSKPTLNGGTMRILNVRLKSTKESQASTRGIVVEVKSVYGIMGGGDILSVSYTHLRAHETPGHRVWRVGV